MDKPKKINTNTLTKLCKTFLKESQKTGVRDTIMAIHSFPHGEGGIAFRMKVDDQKSVTGYFLYRYTGQSKKTKKIPLGKFDPDIFPFSAATEACAPFRAMVKQGIDPDGADLPVTQKRLATFEDVIRFFIYYQEETNKRDKANVKRELLRNILNVKQFESIRTTLAHEVTEDCIERIVSLMVKRGIGRSSNRVKTYITSAYNFSKRRLPKLRVLKEVGFPDVDFTKIRYNPGVDVATDPSFEQSNNSNLTEKQLARFYETVTLNPDDHHKFCMEAATFYFVTLNILLGGHRKRQLIEVEWDRVDFDVRSIEVVDYKGNTGKPREYVLYLPNMAIKCLKQLRELTGGVGQIYPYAESYIPAEFRRYNKWSKASVKYAGLRSTCTTLMKKHFRKVVNNYDPDDVKRIQHHVLGGIQDKHYDKNEYWEEKAHLLKQWEKYLKQKGVWV